MSNRYFIFFFAATLIGGCVGSEPTRSERHRLVCESAAENTDCGGPTDIDECVRDWEPLGMAADNEGCGAQWDAMMDCYGSTTYVCAGSNWPSCDVTEAALATCCGSACVR